MQTSTRMMQQQRLNRPALLPPVPRSAHRRTITKPVHASATAMKHQGIDASGHVIAEAKNIINPVQLGPLVRPGVDDGSIRARFESMIRNAQNTICAAIEEVDGGAKFCTDVWQRNEGGGGISKVLQNGKVWEKAGVAVSVVYGSMTVEALKCANPGAQVPDKGVVAPGTKVPFFAAGISSVMHPWNPHCPTMHFNYRYFEVLESSSHHHHHDGHVPGQWWMAGGTDITPCYIVPEDLQHFHNTYKRVCDAHDPTYYKRFKADCDEYFTIKHRGEMRGMGGIFYEGLDNKSVDELLAFSTDCAAAVVPAYCPIIVKHKDDPYTEQEKQWQQLRRGRYVEYNLIYDRGTIFGLQTGGRVESILMSMPVNARWEYDVQLAPGSREAEFLDAAQRPRDWATC